MDEFVPGDAPIVLGGAFSGNPLTYRYPLIMRYAEKEGGPVFCPNVYGMRSCRYHFYVDFLGVDAKKISSEEYLDIVKSEEYENMPSWPAKGSIKMINGSVVIKNQDNPPE